MAARRHNHRLYAAFPTRETALRAAAGLGRRCGVRIRKFKQPQGDGYLKYGVYVLKGCPL